MCNQKKNLDNRGAAQILIPTVCNFTFLYLFFWIALQSKGLSIDQTAIKIGTSSLYWIKTGSHCKRAKRFCFEKIKGLTFPQKNEFVVKTNGRWVDQRCRTFRFISVDFQTRSKSRQVVVSLFEIVWTNTLFLAKSEGLKSISIKYTDFYDEISKTVLLLKITESRRHLTAVHVTVSNWVSLDFLKIIVECNFTEFLSNLMVALKLFMTVCVSVASCESSFSKLQLTKNYLRATMTEASLSWHIIAIQNIIYEKVISKFTAAKAGKKKF